MPTFNQTPGGQTTVALSTASVEVTPLATTYSYFEFHPTYNVATDGATITLSFAAPITYPTSGQLWPLGPSFS